MLNELFMTDITSWQWFFGIGVVLMLLEICLPAFFLLWIGIACLATAGVQALFDFPLLGQTLCFSCFSIISLTIGYFNYARKSAQNQHQAPASLNNRTEQLIGELFTLEEAIGAGTGEHAKCHVAINDTRWSVRSSNGEPINANQQVRVVSIKGNTLMVQPI
jgi:membrane protein implicated in regulation of membrane protease activity